MYEKLQQIINNSKHLCVFSGAGISCPSGIPDFRSESGIYNQNKFKGFKPEQIISHTFFENNCNLFFDFYKQFMIWPHAKPNKAHTFFSKLEHSGKDVSIVTQNIDHLHTIAGNTKVYEIHGSITSNHCTRCNKFYDLKYIISSDGIPTCSCGGIIKPDVTLYEEQLDNNTVNKAIEAISNCDTLIIIGTSLAVYPANSFIKFYSGKNLIIINKTSTPYDSMCNMAIYDDIINVIDNLSII